MLRVLGCLEEAYSTEIDLILQVFSNLLQSHEDYKRLNLETAGLYRELSRRAIPIIMKLR